MCAKFTFVERINTGHLKYGIHLWVWIFIYFTHLVNITGMHCDIIQPAKNVIYIGVLKVI